MLMMGMSTHTWGGTVTATHILMMGISTRMWRGTVTATHMHVAMGIVMCTKFVGTMSRF